MPFSGEAVCVCVCVCVCVRACVRVRVRVCVWRGGGSNLLFAMINILVCYYKIKHHYFLPK